MHEDFAEEEVLLFILLKRCPKGQKRKKKRKKPRFWVTEVLENMENIQTSAETENWRSRIYFR